MVLLEHGEETLLYDGWQDCDPTSLEAQAEAIRIAEIAKAHKAAMRDCYVFRARRPGRVREGD